MITWQQQFQEMANLPHESLRGYDIFHDNDFGVCGSQGPDCCISG